MEGLNMLYFRKNDEVIEKYQISFDKEKIEKLKKEIINNCSFIKHKEYESDYSPRFTDEIIRNFTYTPTGKEKEYFEEISHILLLGKKKNILKKQEIFVDIVMMNINHLI